MSSKSQKLQWFMHEYRRVTGRDAVDPHDVAAFAISKGLKPPTPRSPVDLLAAEIAAAAREETQHNEKNGHPYRVNHAYRTTQGDRQLTLWVPIYKATRPQMRMALMQRREQSVGDFVQMDFDAEYWNQIHPNDEPIDVPLDVTQDVAERRAMLDAGEDDVG